MRRCASASLLLVLILGLPSLSQARDLRMACASSLIAELKTVAEHHSAQLIPGSTGKLAQQILYGAPFDVFVAADAERPQRLLTAGKARSCATFQTGRLVVWAPVALPADWTQAKLSMAEPRLAPYGLAAQQSLQSRGVWEQQQGRLIRGQNVSQAMQFAASGHVDAALISLAQARHANSGVYAIIDPDQHAPIRHQVCLLKTAHPGAENLYRDILRGMHSE